MSEGGTTWLQSPPAPAWRTPLLRPDAILMGPERVGEVDEDGFHVAPDLVAEVISPGSRSLDLHEKRAIYEELGVGECWVVDHVAGLARVHRLERGAYVVAEVADGAFPHGLLRLSRCQSQSWSHRSSDSDAHHRGASRRSTVE